jgi:hypothetical protein
MRLPPGASLVAASIAVSLACACFKPDVDRTIAEYSSAFSSVVHPPPASEQPKPWKVGQWALYKLTDNGAVGYERLRVVAKDECGDWIEDVQETYHHRWTWLLCIGHGPTPTDRAQALGRLQVVVEQSYDDVAIYDFRTGPGIRPGTRPKREYEGLVSRLFPALRCAACERPPEDVAVPAGRFIAAQHETTSSKDGSVELSRWFRSDVPFDGTVKLVDSHGQYADELLGYEDYSFDDDGVVIDLTTQLVRANEPSGSFFAIGWAPFGGFSGHGSEASSGSQTMNGTFGFRIAPRLDIAGDILAVFVDRYSPDPALSQSLLLGTLGVRWFPFAPPRLWGLPIQGASALYMHGDAGYAQLLLGSTSTDTTTAKGFTAGASIGWLGLQSAHWMLGIEASDHVVFFDAGEGIRNSLAATAFFEFHLPR